MAPLSICLDSCLTSHLPPSLPPSLPSLSLPSCRLLRNDFWGLAGGGEVDLVWAILQPCAEFEALLPADTRAAIVEGRDLSSLGKASIEESLSLFSGKGNKGNGKQKQKQAQQQNKRVSGPLQNFPEYNTVLQNGVDLLSLSPTQWNLLVALAEFMVNENREMIAEVLAG